MDVNKVLGEEIKMLRCSGHLTEEQVSEQTGINIKKYRRIENGLCNISLDILQKVSKVIGVTIKDITKVLDVQEEICGGTKTENFSKKIIDMLDLFYANKHLYEKRKVINEEV